MAAITSLSDFISILTDGTAQHPHTYIDNRVQAVAATTHSVGQMSSLWRYNKSNGANGSLPPTTPGANPSRTTLGSVNYSNASGIKELHLAGLELSGHAAGVLHLYDRLYHMSGLSATVTTAQTVGGAITRNASGAGNQIWIEIYTTIGATPTTITASYTNQAGVSGKTTHPIAIGNTNLRETERIIRLPLADGDTGVQSVQSVTLAATTGTAGNFGITIAKPIARGFIEAPGAAMLRDFITGASPTAPVIETDACLSFAWTAAQTPAPKIDVTLNLVEK